jgi:putative ABC transport system permease protein
MSVQRDVDAELRFHFDARIEELMGQGMSRELAHARAVEEFGDVDETRTRLEEIDRRVARRRNRIEWIEGVVQDVSYAVRSLSRTPAVAITIIVTLALGLGVNAAIFSLLDQIFVRPPSGVVQPSEVRLVWTRRQFTSGTQFWSGYDYQSYDAIAQAVAGQATTTLYRAPAQLPLGHGENAPHAGVSLAAASYFPLLGVKPELGRFYGADEDGLDTPAPVAVVSDAFWKRALGGTSDAIGRTITISNHVVTVIGVAPPAFTGTELDATDIWLPLAAFMPPRRADQTPWWRSVNANGFQVLVRMAPGAHDGELASRSTAALRAPGGRFEHDTVADAALASIIRARGPGELRGEMHVATRLAGVAAIVLLIACANVVNLLLARAVRRRREIAVRLALGISRSRLVRLLVTESVMLALVATAAALMAATWGGALLRTLLMPEVHFADSPLQWQVFLFAIGVAVAAGVLSGLIPALQAASPDLTIALKVGAREGGAQRSRLRDGLVVTQAALSLVLLVGAVLFVRSLHNVKERDIGYSVGRLVFGRVAFDSRDSIRDAAMSARLLALEPRLAAIPGVNRVAFTSMRPKYGISFVDYFPDIGKVKKQPTGVYTAVTPEYFATSGTKLTGGRTFTAHPGPNAAYEVIVNQTEADAIWPKQDPIGHCVRFNADTMPCATVVGVAETAILNSLDEKPWAQFYVSIEHSPVETWGAATIVLRADPERVPSVQRALHDLLRDEFAAGIPRIESMAEVMEPDYRPWKLGATLFTLFGLLALVVAGVGIYSSVSYAVSQRTHEFGVRVALGARTADIVRQVVGEGVRVVLVGVVLGILMALAVGRLVASLLYGIAASDPAAMSMVAAILVLIAITATLLPAWRAGRSDPMGALRAE